ncbi:MAG TPA: hypothetical protein VMM12_03940 [Longimicrobiales bacterium]|nr:hypothetical protein [Longimicrobiales bacterium]
MALTRPARRVAAPVVAVLAVGCGGPHAGPPPPGLGPGPAPWAVVVIPEAGASAVGLAVVVAGSGWEDERRSGATLLAAEALLEESAAGLETLGASASVSCGRWAFVFTVVAPPETWRAAAEILASGLSDPAPTVSGLERARARLAASLALDRASPAWQARLAAGRALYGDGAVQGRESAWSRPGCGVPETLPLIDLAAVRAAGERLGQVASVAAVGSVDAAAGGRLASAFRPGGVTAAFPLPGRASPGRVYVERNTVTAWVSVAWPYGPDADAEAVRLVGSLLADAVRPGLSRPEILHAGAEVERHGRGGALVVTAVVAPERAEVVATTLEAEVWRLAAGTGPEAGIERVSRRHRGVRLRELSSPEARAARIALERAAGAAAGPWPAPGSWTWAAAREAARALGPPARAVVGPRAARAAAVP